MTGLDSLKIAKDRIPDLVAKTSNDDMVQLANIAENIADAKRSERFHDEIFWRIELRKYLGKVGWEQLAK